MEAEVARVVLAHETIFGSDQIYDAYIIGQFLVARGHDVIHIVDAAPSIYYALGARFACAEIREVQLPPKLSIRPKASMAALSGSNEKLGEYFSDAFQLNILANAWSRELRRAAPDVIVAISAPATWLVGPDIAPTLATGSGAAIPVWGDDVFVKTAAERGSGITSNLLLRNANSVLAELGSPQVKSLAGILRCCEPWHYGFDALDPYLPYRQSPSLGMLGSMPKNDPVNGSSLSVFLDINYPNLENVLLAIAGLGGIKIDLFVNRATTAMRNFLSRLPGITLWDQFDSTAAEVPKAGAIIHHGASMLATLGIAAGRPHLVLPWTGEQWAVLEMLKQLGVAWWKNSDSSIEELSGTLRAFLNDVNIRVQAEQQRTKVVEDDLDNALLIIDSAVKAGATSNHRKRSDTSSASSRLEDSANATDVIHAPDEISPALETGSKTFCALPFQHLCIGTEGTARICCMAHGNITQNSVPMSLYRNTVDEIWNSNYMQNIRRAMAEGRPLTQCEACYANESATGQSYRTLTGLKPLDRQPLDQQSARNAGEPRVYRREMPGFLKLELGNLCNLKCRMCCGNLSSEIERDPVHCRWNGGDEPLHAVWNGDVALIGPDFKIGIARSGVYDPERHEEKFYSWTNGRAKFDVPVGNLTAISALEIEFLAPLASGRHYEISANSVKLASGTIDPSKSVVWLDLSSVPLEKSIVIDIASETIQRVGDPRPLGLPLVRARLHRKTRDKNPNQKFQVLDLKSNESGLWYHNDRLIFKDLLGDRARLQRLFVTGGEPLLEPRFFEIIDFLIDAGRADDIDIEIVTNGTCIDERIIAKLLKFRSLSLCLSLDGVGEVYDYMRYPARWENVERKVRLLTQLAPSSVVVVTPVIQIYNILDIANLCRFCSTLGVGFIGSLIQEPERLKVENLPDNVRRIAGKRLRSYGLNDCPPQHQNHILSMANYLETDVVGRNPEMLHEFMLFTNDLDRTRGQSMRDSLPELYELITEGGLRWSDETRYASERFARRSARDRVHAWI
jgi:hypothetical protein